MDGLAIAASLSEIRDAAEGGLVRTVYRPERGVFLLHVYAGRPIRILISPIDAAIHLTGLRFENPPTS